MSSDIHQDTQDILLAIGDLKVAAQCNGRAETLRRYLEYSETYAESVFEESVIEEERETTHLPSPSPLLSPLCPSPVRSDVSRKQVGSGKQIGIVPRKDRATRVSAPPPTSRSKSYSLSPDPPTRPLNLIEQYMGNQSASASSRLTTTHVHRMSAIQQPSPSRNHTDGLMDHFDDNILALQNPKSTRSGRNS